MPALAAPLHPAPAGGMRGRVPGSYRAILSGKYRGIMAAVACFLVFDLAVLLLNLALSYELGADAQAINLAGRQRMLSQRIAKALFSLESVNLSGDAQDAARDELAQSAALFDTTLSAFAGGGAVSGGDGHTASTLAPVAGSRGQAIIAEAAATWKPLAAALRPLARGSPLRAADLGAAAQAARAANLHLLDLMNQLTSELEAQARAKADRLRTIQAAGIVLALLNFALIVFGFIARLEHSDRAAEAARRETAQILGSIGEGLFLIDRELRIGIQATAALARILGRPAPAGAPFAQLLESLAAPEVQASARDYIGLLFDARIKPGLIAELNPLAEVRVPGTPERHLSFRFTAVAGSDGAVSHLLVAVTDITEAVLLRRDLASARHLARNEIEMLLGVLSSSPGALGAFGVEAESALRDANRRLRHPGTTPDELRATIDAVFRRVHAIKGDAAALGLALFEIQAHEFEGLLAGLRARAELSPQDLLGLPLKLEEFYERLSQVRAFADQISRAAARTLSADSDGAQRSAQLDLSLTQLAQRIARDEHKEVQVQTSLAPLARLAPATAKHVKDIALQLARNAVAHGIEAPDERTRLSKPEAGQIEVRLSQVADDEYELVMRDDGRGLDPALIRAQLHSSGRYAQGELAELDDRQVMMKIFEPGFSTARTAGRDSGRGVGLDLVNDKIRRLGGHLRLASQPGHYTEFSVRFAV